MKEALKKDGATKADMRAADAFLAQFDPNLVTAQWLDKRGTIAKGTKLFISTSPEGNVVTEVSWAERAAELRWRRPRLCVG